MSKFILIVTTFNNHFSFFARMKRAMNKLDYEPIFLTNKHSIFLEAEKEGLSIYKIHKGSKLSSEIDISEAFEIAKGDLSFSNGKTLLSNVCSVIESLNVKYNFEYIFLWGGVRLIEYVASQEAIRYGIKTVFFELGNFPGKIFVDPKGTNAKSLLAKKNVLINSPDMQPYELWKGEYLNKSLASHKVPQSSSVASIDVKKNILDLIGFKLKGYSQNEPILRLDKLKNKLMRRFWKFNYDEVDFKNSDYVFYPMQVSDDAQLILNSDVDNSGALVEISEYAKKNNLEFLVKPHPAEVDFGYVKKIEKLKSELGFKFVSYNTIELIMNAKKVFTINSTVGLQALILEKEIQCFGKALYKDFNTNQLAAYVTDYLIDMDFWGNGEITTENISFILKRAELQ